MRVDPVTLLVDHNTGCVPRWTRSRYNTVEIHIFIHTYIHIYDIYNIYNIYTHGRHPIGVFGNFNSLAPGKFEWNFRHVIFKQILVIDGWGISCAIALIWMSLDVADDQSTLVQVMAWCRQATSHYLSQCWPRSLSPYGVTRPQWVKSDHVLLFVFLLCNATPCYNGTPTVQN